VPRPDSKTAILRSLVKHWFDIHKLSDRDVATLILIHGIDVLIHTMGHWTESRISVFAYRPAPVQLSYLFQSPTTGMRSFDRLLADGLLDAGQWTEHAAEKIVHMRTTHVTQYDTAPGEGLPPCFANGFTTFGSFNAPRKISEGCLDLWAAVMRQVPRSRMLLKGRGMLNSSLGGALRAGFKARGVEEERIDLLEWTGTAFEAHSAIDIHLDTVPFNGGRTTEDAIWMGVPVVTISRGGVYSRMGASLLSRIGLAELCATNPGEFVAIASNLANNPERLRSLKQELRSKFIQAHNPIAHVQELEAEIRAAWKTWCEERQAD
jgi:protein O-GlcNAc transferase